MLAQEPVPEAEKAVPVAEAQLGTATALSGRVTDDTGAVVPGAKITIVSRDGRFRRTVITGPTGSYRIPRVPVGTYRVTASLPGFSAEQRTIEVRPATSAEADFVFMGGPVPEGEPTPEPDVPEPERGAETSPDTAVTHPEETTSGGGLIEVARETLHSDIELQKRLNARAQEGMFLRAVVPIEDGTSLFVYESADPESATVHLVLPVNQAPDPAGLKDRIELHQGKQFVGLHRLSEKSYLMVFRHRGQ